MHLAHGVYQHTVTLKNTRAGTALIPNSSGSRDPRDLSSVSLLGDPDSSPDSCCEMAS